MSKTKFVNGPYFLFEDKDGFHVCFNDNAGHRQSLAHDIEEKEENEMSIRKQIENMLSERDMTTSEIAGAINRHTECARASLMSLEKLGRIRMVRSGVIGSKGSPAVWGKPLAR